MKRYFTALLVLTAIYVSAQTTVLQENFTSYAGTAVTVPTGWTFTYNGDYTTAANSGASGPNSYKFGVNTATIVTPAFSNADTLHFWIKGLSTDANSSLKVEQSPDSVTWSTINALIPLPTTGTNYTFAISTASTRLRFTYTKSAGNLAFDDFLLTKTTTCGGGSGGTSAIKIYFNRPVNTSLASSQQAVYLNQLVDDTLIQYINRAKYTIDVAVYNFIITSGISNIATAINNAYTRGVKIRWIYNGSSSNTGLTSLNSGIHTLGSPTTSSYGIMHNKFMVVDAHSASATDPLVWTGSCNWDEEQIDSDYNNIVIIQDKNLALAYTQEFNQMWGDTGLAPNAATSKFGPFKSNITPHSFNIGGVTVESYFSPSDSTNVHILDAINSANSQLFFGVYTFTETANANAIVARNNAGVYTAGIVDQYSTTFGAYPILTAGLGTKVKSYAQPNSIYHNKFVIVDPCNLSSDPLVETGSHNWTSSADSKNDENTLIIHDATVANLYYQSFYQNFTDLHGTLIPCQVTNNCANAITSNIQVNNQVLCHGAATGNATIHAHGAGAPFTYVWDSGPAQTDSVLNGVAAGTYVVTVTDANSCSVSASVTITEPAAISISGTVTNDNCFDGNNGAVAASVTGGTAGYNYLWNSSPQQTTATATALVAGIYILTVTDAANCTATANFTVAQPASLPQATFTINADSLKAATATTYQWYLDGNAIGGATADFYVVQAAGFYALQITDANGCIGKSDSVFVGVTGAEMLQDNFGFNVYPNPSNSCTWHVTVSDDWIGGQCELFNAAGKVAYKAAISKKQSDISLDLGTGIYILKVYSPLETITIKLIKL